MPQTSPMNWINILFTFLLFTSIISMNLMKIKSTKKSNNTMFHMNMKWKW